MVESNHSDEDTYLADKLEGFGLSDVDEFEKHPFWQLFVESNNHKAENLSDRLIQGDIGLYVQADPSDYFGSKYRTNEALRGAIIELLGMSMFLEDVRASITAFLEEEGMQIEEEIGDDS